MNKKLIAIGIPTYKAHSTLPRLLSSIAIQSIADKCKIYLANDEPSDKPLYTDIIKQFPSLDIVELLTDVNGGPGVARNRCIEASTEDVITFADADDAYMNMNIFKNLYFDNNVSLSQNQVKTTAFGTKTHILTPSFTLNSDLFWKANTWSAGINFNYRSKMFVDMPNEHEIPEAWTINLFGNIRFNRYELGINLNNITNKVNYCTGAVGAENKTLYFAMARFNFMTNLKVYF